MEEIEPRKVWCRYGDGTEIAEPLRDPDNPGDVDFKLTFVRGTGVYTKVREEDTDDGYIEYSEEIEETLELLVSEYALTQLMTEARAFGLKPEPMRKRDRDGLRCQYEKAKELPEPPKEPDPQIELLFSDPDELEEDDGPMMPHPRGYLFARSERAVRQELKEERGYTDSQIDEAIEHMWRYAKEHPDRFYRESSEVE